MKKFLFLVPFLALLCAIDAQASGCVVRQRVVQHQVVQAAVVVQQAVVVTPVVAAVFVPTVVVPAYSVGYASAACDNSHEVAQLKQQLQIEQLKRQVQALQFQGKAPVQPLTMPQAKDVQPKDAPKDVPAKPAAQGQHPALQIMANKCLTCHSAASAKTKGDGFDLTAPLDDKALLNIARAVYSGRMPKNGKLTDDEVGEIMDWIDQSKK